jgi:hypothetical protein
LAADRRRKRSTRERYAAAIRILSTVAFLTLPVVAYLAGMANVTRLNYELARSNRERAQLADESARLDDRIARLRSRERLARIAARLGMHEAPAFAVVSLPAPPPVAPPPTGLAFLHLR